MTKRIFIFFFAFSLFWGCGETEQQITTPSIRPVKYVKLADSDQSHQHFYTGLSKARTESALSFRVGGTITKRFVEVGDRVKKGQLLATLDPTDYNINYNQSLASVKSSEAQIRTSEAQLESAKASYISAESNYKRFQNLYETNSVSLSDFEQAKANYEASKANYEAAKSQVVAAKAGANSCQSVALSAANQISYTRLTTPFAGIISAVQAEQNEAVGQGTPIMIINSDGNPKVEVGVPENMISQVRENAEVEVNFTSISNKTYKGIVTEVGYSPSGSTYPVTIELNNGDEKIRPGMPCDVRLDFHEEKKGKQSIMRIPSSAAGSDKDGSFVYVLTPSNDNIYQAKRTNVKLGELTDAGFEVLSGLSAGQYVAAAGLNNLRDGMEVRLFSDQ